MCKSLIIRIIDVVPKYLLDLGLTFGALELLDGVLEEVLVGGETGVLGDTIVVLAGQETGSER